MSSKKRKIQNLIANILSFIEKKSRSLYSNQVYIFYHVLVSILDEAEVRALSTIPLTLMTKRSG